MVLGQRAMVHVSTPTEREDAEDINGAVACSLGANGPDQPRVDVGRRELIAEEDVTNTAGVEDRAWSAARGAQDVEDMYSKEISAISEVDAERVDDKDIGRRWNPTVHDVCGKTDGAATDSSGAKHSDQPSMDVGRREIVGEGVTITPEKEDRTEALLESLKHAFNNMQERSQRWSRKSRTHR